MQGEQIQPYPIQNVIVLYSYAMHGGRTITYAADTKNELLDSEIK